MQEITITETGTVLQTKEIDGVAYFKSQEEELDRVEKQIAHLQGVRLKIIKRMEKKPVFEDVKQKLEKKLAKQKKEEEELQETHPVEEPVTEEVVEPIEPLDDVKENPEVV